MPIAVGIPDDVVAYLRERYGESIMNDCMGIVARYEVGELQRIELQLIVHRERREGET